MLSPLLLKVALISTEGKQPRVTATGESGLMDEVKELPWSEFGNKAWPGKADDWRQLRAGSPGGSGGQSGGGWRTLPELVRTVPSSGPGGRCGLAQLLCRSAK